MTMRKSFSEISLRTLELDPTAVVILGDIGVHSFERAFKQFPSRVYNLGILEQSMVSLAAGLAKSGLRPIVHTIAPFLVERAFEQLKVDFGYQKLSGHFVSVGGSYDYAALGCTHHCPADVSLLKSIPDFGIIAPGHPLELERLFTQTWANPNPCYFRLSEKSNPTPWDVKWGHATVVKTGRDATVIAIGPMLDAAMKATEDLDVNLLYYTSLHPFDKKTLHEITGSQKILVVQPDYRGSLTQDILDTFDGKNISIDCIGVARDFIRNYGHRSEIDEMLQLTPNGIRERLLKLIQKSNTHREVLFS